MNRGDLAPLIEYIALAPTVTAEHVAEMCAEARRHRFASIRVNPLRVLAAAGFLQGSETRVSTVVGYPLGALTVRQKVYESMTALDDGALDILMIPDVAAILVGDEETARGDILSVAEVLARNPYAVLKVGLDLSLFDEMTQAAAVKCAIEGGAHYVVALARSDGTAIGVERATRLVDATDGVIGIEVDGVCNGDEAEALMHVGVSLVGCDTIGAALTVAH